MGDWCVPCPSLKSTTTPQGALGVPLKRKFLKNNMAFRTQGCTQGDWTIRSPELSNRHMSLSWPLGRLVITQRIMRDTHPLGALVLGWGGWPHGITLCPPIFQKMDRDRDMQPRPELAPHSCSSEDERWTNITCQGTKPWRSFFFSFLSLQIVTCNVVQNKRGSDLWGTPHTIHFGHHPSTSPWHLFMNIIPAILGLELDGKFGVIGHNSPSSNTNLGWGGWAHGTTLFPHAHSFIFQKKDRDRYIEPPPKLAPHSCSSEHERWTNKRIKIKKTMTSLFLFFMFFANSDLQCRTKWESLVRDSSHHPPWAPSVSISPRISGLEPDGKFGVIGQNSPSSNTSVFVHL